ncbi:MULTISPECIES: DUF484 family protein [unclassified Roseateles]|uniref:DUF484 family protein n=1 Tax=unclassified Roseateles TaxID=2626991 RepID=UPI0006FFC22D|nr:MULTISPECIES: DUF484 family protein [unclassified Roseateles]KQW46247.1 hypothetical protein ASC81_07475 [Pelomonas sp. Root405]KRA73296.1 hypothetical protein ASD88_07475 [Pelomonas sp. Root662]
MSSNPAADAVQGITETDIANYLATTPGFFERHSALLASVQLQHPHGARAVSLQERQAEMLRDKIKGLELRLIDMIRNGQDNVAIADRLHRWTLAVMRAVGTPELPHVLLAELRHQFMIPQAGLRLWGVKPEHEASEFAASVSPDVKSFASSLSQPYCGVNSGFEAARWLGLSESGGTATSLALIPLHQPSANQDKPFGLLVLGSPDPTRYTAEMGTDFLTRVGEIASAGLAGLLAT